MSERKRYLIDVEMDTVNLTGNGEWCSVRIPSNGPCVIPVRFRDLRDAPDDEQTLARKQRDEAQAQVAELEAQVRSHEQLNGDLTHMLDKAEEEHMQAERERDRLVRERDGVPTKAAVARATWSSSDGVLLERDGVPTDEGLRRLAEKAGLGFERHESSVGTEGMQIDEGVPHLRVAQATLYGDSPKWRKRLADALREMGGA